MTGIPYWYQFALDTGFLITPSDLAQVLTMEDGGRITRATGKHVLRKMWKRRYEFIHLLKEYAEKHLNESDQSNG